MILDAWRSTNHSLSPSTQNSELAKLPAKVRLEEKGAKWQGMSEKGDKQVSSVAGRPGTDIRPGCEGKTAAVAGLFLAIGTEGLSNSPGSWAGGQAVNIHRGLGVS